MIFLVVAWTGLNVGFYRADLAGRGFLPKASRALFSRHLLVPIALVCRKYTDNIKSAACVAMQGGCLCFLPTRVTVYLVSGIT